MFDFSRERIIGILLSLPAVIFCLSIHELAHGWTASKLGDNTAKNLGRLTMNPLSHLDLWGFLSLLLVGFGWAKPVPVYMRNFKKPKRDMALTALAGPAVNLISAFLFAFVYQGALFLMRKYINANYSYFNPAPESLINVCSIIKMILYYFVILNISLAIFNLIPIPPLDGSRILDSFLPSKVYIAYHKYEQYISMALLLILLCTDILDPALSSACGFVENIIMYIPSKVFSI